MQICKTQAIAVLKNIFYTLALMFKSRFEGKEIKIIVYGQYLLNYETPIKENPSELTRVNNLYRTSEIPLITFTGADFFI